MFLPLVVITDDFTRFLPAGKNTFGHGKKLQNSNIRIKDQNHMKNVYVMSYYLFNVLLRAD